MPGSFLSDCKTGHSATMLAEKIYARKIFLISPVTTVDSDYLYNNNTRGLAGMEFVMWTRSLKYSNIFEVVDKYFSPTLNQKIGQAKNKQGIVLLQTKPSFTQDPKVLIEELKLIIDRDNLKAD